MSELRKQAQLLGFDSLGVTDPTHQNRTSEALKSFVEAGHHGTMGWMSDTFNRRSDPKALWPEVRSIVMLTMNYGPETDPLEQLQKSADGTISVYARNRDYHDVIKGRLKTLASKLSALASKNNIECQIKVFVDTAPVMEKPLAERAGLGWQGKHTNLVSRQSGSWLFIGSIFTTLDLPCDDEEIDHCGSCSDCLDICPTNAFPAPYKLDARRCISYLTIEHKGTIPEEFRKAMGNRIFGCDDCLAVCPWNKFARAAEEVKLAAPPIERPSDLQTLLSFNDAKFRQVYSASPVKRIGRDRFIRNCLIAAGNSQSPDLIAAVQPHCANSSDIVRETAEWAMQQLSGLGK
ncbi:MAG: tRNA epoxyqueuosine(34) reductase QueG [Rhizobiaceae bacterium]|nr:tRNA epoxyqueuosine(34) reductase QueG [Rhizobiaceae bacterium]